MSEPAAHKHTPKGALVVPDKVAERDMDTTVIMRQFIPDWLKASNSNI